MYDPISARQERQDAICARGSIHVDCRAPASHRHVMWMVVIAITVSPVAVHAGSVATWAMHLGASWDHMWSRPAAAYKQLRQVSGEFARQNGAGSR